MSFLGGRGCGGCGGCKKVYLTPFGWGWCCGGCGGGWERGVEAPGVSSGLVAYFCR